MREKSIRIAVVFVVALLSISAVYAAAVTVTPANMQGWTTAVYPAGTAKCGIYATPGASPVGSYAFYGATGERINDSTQIPAQVWVGTNAYAGVALKDITKLTYTTYTDWRGIDYSHRASQPFQLQLIVQKSPTNTNKRLLMYRPWSLRSSEEIFNPWGQWETHNAIRCKSTLTHCDVVNGNSMTVVSCWYIANGSDQLGHTWAEIADPVTGSLKDAIIVVPPQGFGWDGGTIPEGVVNNTATGCGLNFTVGGRKTTVNIFGSPDYAWWREGFNFSGYMDSFTIGVNGVDTTYNFEAAPAAGTYAIGNKYAKSVAVDNAKGNHKFVVSGKVELFYRTPVANKIYDNQNFLLNDGSGVKMLVHTPSYNSGLVANGNYVRVEGYIDTSTTPATIYTTFSDITPLYQKFDF